MSEKSRDRELGMNRKITRRDFLDGAALAVGGAVVASAVPRVFGLSDFASAPEKNPAYYPPALTGLRGNHEGSYPVAHSLRDHTFWDSAAKPENIGETYDLVVVGGGISGREQTRASSFSTTTTILAATPSAMSLAQAGGCY
jgi:spermidine dehydrogenase